MKSGIFIWWAFYPSSKRGEVWSVEVTTVFRLAAVHSALFLIRQYQEKHGEKKSSWRLGTCSSQLLTLLEKLLVTEHETDLAWVQLEMPVNNMKQAASFPPCLANAEYLWELALQVQHYHHARGATALTTVTAALTLCYGEEMLMTKNEFFLLFFWLVGWWINYSHSSNYSS